MLKDQGRTTWAVDVERYPQGTCGTTMDMENIINWEEGYVALENSNKHRISIIDCEEGEGSVVRENSNDLRIAIPTTLMDVGRHFDDIPWVAQ